MSTVSFLRYVPAIPSHIDAQRQKPSLPSSTSGRGKTSERPSSVKSRPGSCRTPLMYTSNFEGMWGGSSTRVLDDTPVECPRGAPEAADLRSRRRGRARDRAFDGIRRGSHERWLDAGSAG